MKSPLRRLPGRRAVTIEFGETEISVRRVVLTPLGPSVVDVRSRPTGSERIETSLSSLLEPFVAGRAGRSTPVVVGLPTLNVFFSTRPILPINRGASAQVQLHEMLKSSTLNIDDMEVDMIGRQVGKSPAASVVACQKRTLQPILQALQDCGIRPRRVEPAVFGLLREAVRRHRSPRRAKTTLRVFLGAGSATAILTANDMPLMWRSAPLEPGRESATTLSLLRCVEKITTQAGVDAAAEAVMIHGRPDLAGLCEGPDWGTIRAAVSRHDGPSLAPDDVAAGLALSAYDQADSFNLARSLSPRVPMWRRMPWGQLVAQGAMMAAGAFLLTSHLADLDAADTAIAAERSSLPWLRDQTVAKLEEERTKLSKRLEVIQGFTGGRIVWSAGLREVAEGLPANMALTSVEGRCDYRPDSNGKENLRQSKRSLIASVSAPIPKGEAIPREIDDLLSSLRSNPKLKEDLPTVELGNLRWGSTGAGKTPVATFSVVCLPKTAAPTKASAPPTP